MNDESFGAEHKGIGKVFAARIFMIGWRDFKQNRLFDYHPIILFIMHLANYIFFTLQNVSGSISKICLLLVFQIFFIGKLSKHRTG